MRDPLLRDRMSGVVTALVTPMNGAEIDLEAFDAHVERQLAAGVSGVSPIGTTGEAATLTDHETAAIIEATVKRASGRALVIAGAGSNSTRGAIDKARRAESLGADALLVVTPYYNKPSQAGLADHFAAVAAAVSVPVLLYNVPGRTGVDLAVETSARLVREVANIVGIKEAGGKVERFVELRVACGEDVILFTGDDPLALPALAAGADGVYSVASNLIPDDVIALYRAWSEGRSGEAAAIYRRLYTLMDNLFIESNPVPVKAALAHRGIMKSDVRAPLAALSPASWKTLAGSLAAINS